VGVDIQVVKGFGYAAWGVVLGEAATRTTLPDTDVVGAWAAQTVHGGVKVQRAATIGKRKLVVGVARRGSAAKGR
jgi:hypothetical protein